MLFAGIGHLTFSRTEFQAQVPVWSPLDPDFVVVASGVLEIMLGLEIASAEVVDLRTPLARASGIRGWASLALVNAMTVFRRPELPAGDYK